MTANISPSENQSLTNTDEECSIGDSMKPTNTDTNPLVPPSSTETAAPSTVSSSCDVPEFEYEFSTSSHGQIMWIHLWDTDDRSACERVVNRNLTGETVSYSQDTGNGFVEDRWGNTYTFTKKKVTKTSYGHPDFGTLETDIPPAGLKEKPVARVTVKASVDVMDILNSI